ncbi:15-hydroxyprostaglandin dehydrogenase [NAD(+)] [Zancudomyces culisetae]|uniref:15-hydroxyprostaglandin dehydrogenase [NAD(+)] n=1 Tax=Zancudomyces culisetae TaxID=1213189 RepID=A0A1R1PJ73_ZANCU|nr:15-hydroxyprostaglandin dehydrogenase [NAD(+)] [Zancudomyces culisetae]|eukprot:OMH80902.1 15-hydroxyprostaglandin dehydrogenase [NAD(+)] [Zancudomyces culisetae]
MTIKDKVAIVTGAARGFGKRIAEVIVEKGGKVIVSDILDGEDVARQLNEAKGKKVAVFVKCDVSKTEDLEKTLSLAISEFGRLDILVNNAGIGGTPVWGDKDSRMLRKTIEVDLISVIDFTRLAVAYWNTLPCGENETVGVVVNVASNMAFFPASTGPAYGPAKAGVVNFTATCASLYPKIRVNAVAPNYADTDMLRRALSAGGNNLNVIKKNAVLTVDEVVDNMIRCIEDESLVGDTIKLIAGKPPLVHKQRKAAKL